MKKKRFSEDQIIRILNEAAVSLTFHFTGPHQNYYIKFFSVRSIVLDSFTFLYTASPNGKVRFA